MILFDEKKARVVNMDTIISIDYREAGTAEKQYHVYANTVLADTEATQVKLPLITYKTKEEAEMYIKVLANRIGRCTTVRVDLNAVEDEVRKATVTKEVVQ